MCLLLIPTASAFRIKSIFIQACDLILHAAPKQDLSLTKLCFSIFKELFHRTVMINALYYIIVVMLNYQGQQKTWKSTDCAK